MSEKFVVQLSEQAAPSHWGENAALSFNEQGATVHLSEQETLKNVQKAARTIASQGEAKVLNRLSLRAIHGAQKANGLFTKVL